MYVLKGDIHTHTFTAEILQQPGTWYALILVVSEGRIEERGKSKQVMDATGDQAFFFILPVLSSVLPRGGSLVPARHSPGRNFWLTRGWRERRGGRDDIYLVVLLL